ncbi:MAG: mandelate racemase/muconate lactonizing enzyme family protein, partial [Halobacteriaceae archaeon]
MGNHDFDPADEPDYRIQPGGGVPWRDLSMEEEHRPPERDVEITGIETMVLAGNFDWGIVKVETDAGVYGIGEAFLAGAAVDIVHRVEPFLVGENPLDIARLVEYQSGWGHRERAAFAGIEAACWDVKGKVLDV